MSASPAVIVLGTRNAKKRTELARQLQPFGISVAALDAFPQAIDIVEDGSSFAENARLKACRQARHLQEWVLGEDSGLVVDALDGAPGIYSARFSGPQATDESNNRLLLEKLNDVPDHRRSGHYVCYAVLSNPHGDVVAECEGRCRGRIRSSARGNHGFGYDPLFEIVEYHRTFGELGPAVKSVISHRARAMRQLISRLHPLTSSMRQATAAHPSVGKSVRPE